MKKELSLVENSLLDYSENWATKEEKQKIDVAFKEISDAVKNKETLSNNSSISYIDLILTSYYFEDSISTDTDLQKRILKALKTLKRKLTKGEED